MNLQLYGQVIYSKRGKDIERGKEQMGGCQRGRGWEEERNICGSLRYKEKI